MDDWKPEAVTFTFHVDREIGVERVTVERWPRQIEVERSMFATVSPERLRQGGSTITIVVENGQAVYQVVKHDVLRDRLLAQLESSRLSPAPQGGGGEGR